MDAIKSIFAAINELAQVVLVIARTLRKYATVAEKDADEALKAAQIQLEE